jgi:hypothetical protein
MNMLKDKNSKTTIGFDLPTKYLALAAIGLAVLAFGLLSFSALGSSSLMF